MSESERVAIIAASGVVLSSILGTMAAFLALMASKRNARAIQEVHLSVNGRLEQLISASHARGQIEERDNQRAVEIRAADKAANLEEERGF
jgi:uncharacterized membrane protein